ncbi:MAG: hypothetical protein IPF60_11305 [Betaproteobacteria bacterium]|nr:hypothetical protein [Betaproteobacteria bacterium]
MLYHVGAQTVLPPWLISSSFAATRRPPRETNDRAADHHRQPVLFHRVANTPSTDIKTVIVSGGTFLE